MKTGKTYTSLECDGILFRAAKYLFENGYTGYFFELYEDTSALRDSENFDGRFDLHDNIPYDDEKEIGNIYVSADNIYLGIWENDKIVEYVEID